MRAVIDVRVVTWQGVSRMCPQRKAMATDWQHFVDAGEGIAMTKCWWPTQPTLARVLRVVDGDTIKVSLPWQGGALKWTCRLWGINTPELRRGDEESRARGRRCTEMLEARLPAGSLVILVLHPQKDSFGRLLASVYAHDELANACAAVGWALADVLPQCWNVNEWLLLNGPGTLEFYG